MTYSGTRRPMFGPVDPYCVPAAASLAGAAILLAVVGSVLFSLGMGVLALLLIVFDSWANRYDRLERRQAGRRLERYSRPRNVTLRR
jgi:hypothetical protein